MLSWRRPSVTARSRVSRGMPSGWDAVTSSVTVTVAPVATSGVTATLMTSRTLLPGIWVAVTTTWVESPLCGS